MSHITDAMQNAVVNGLHSELDSYAVIFGLMTDYSQAYVQETQSSAEAAGVGVEGAVGHGTARGRRSGLESEGQQAIAPGMSMTPIEVALERLELEGFVSVSPHQGIVARELSVHEIADQYEIRASRESYTLRALAGR